MLTSDFFNKPTTEEKRRLDPKCWDGKKIGNPKTKLKGGVRVNNCVSVEEETENNPIDTVEMDVPLLIRALEYARENVKNDIELHKVVERMIAAAQNGETLNMDDYNMIFGDSEQAQEQGVVEGKYEGMYSPDAIEMGNYFIKEFNLTDKMDQQLAIEIVDNSLEGGLTNPTQIRNQVIKYLKQSGVVIQSRKQGVAEETGDKPFDNMMKKVTKTPTAKARNTERIRQKREREEETRDRLKGGFGPSPADKLSIREPKEGSSGAMANAASRLVNKDDGKVAKLRAAGDKRREDQLKSRNIAKKNEDADGRLVKQYQPNNRPKTEGMSGGKFDLINDDDFYEYNVDSKEIVARTSVKDPTARKFTPNRTMEWPGRDDKHKIVKGFNAKYLKPKGQDVVDEAKKKKKSKSSSMSKPTKRTYGGYFYPGYGYGSSGDSGGGDGGGGGGESRMNESRLYYTVAGTLNESLRKDFKMRKDRKGWFLPESASSRQKLDAERAFGGPINEADLLRPIKMNATKDPVARSENASKFKNPAKLIQFKR